MPATALLNLTTPTGWVVIKEIVEELGSGGNFCHRYLAQSPDGRIGFLKAMDLRNALSAGIKAVNEITKNYLFEQETLFYCKNKRMTRVVVPLDAGEIVVPGFPVEYNTVYYVIFELADGDMRQQHMDAVITDWLPALTALHHTSVGVNQLHRADIAHQDIKPSNILYFEDNGSKVSDLGRVTDRAGTSPFSNLDYTGDLTYRPPEVMHGSTIKDFSDRFCCDMYMVGSLAYQIVTGIQISSVLINEARKTQPNVRALAFKDALPVYLNAFSLVLDAYYDECTKLICPSVANLLRNVVSEMCHPDPEKRGPPRLTNKEVRYSMVRYTGLFANIVRTYKVKARCNHD